MQYATLTCEKFVSVPLIYVAFVGFLVDCIRMTVKLGISVHNSIFIIYFTLCRLHHVGVGPHLRL